mmetsp:Transcript_8057/g.24897  ORF Transcript_8057/g.24897 Transcript_8057/m.24897 type:complete len:306 (+) Transcript_8057:37-954(+)
MDIRRPKQETTAASVGREETHAPVVVQKKKEKTRRNLLAGEALLGGGGALALALPSREGGLLDGEVFRREVLGGFRVVGGQFDGHGGFFDDDLTSREVVVGREAVDGGARREAVPFEESGLVFFFLVHEFQIEGLRQRLGVDELGLEGALFLELVAQDVLVEGGLEVEGFAPVDLPFAQTADRLRDRHAVDDAQRRILDDAAAPVDLVGANVEAPAVEPVEGLREFQKTVARIFAFLRISSHDAPVAVAQRHEPRRKTRLPRRPQVQLALDPIAEHLRIQQQRLVRESFPEVRRRRRHHRRASSS